MAEINNDDKIWEKPWDIKDLHTHSTSWSLAGDAGLLLQLKQFSENIISKSILIEKQLQSLSFEEQQCSTQLNNSISSFLVLENSQFIENRVYEEDLTETKAQLADVKPPDKTKEEKEQELFAKINEALNVGMSIMDNYFDKIDVNALKKETGSDEEEEAEEEIESDLKKQKGAEELIIYETKDPYVLHSLPYLIGSKSYLENDHVGLKDFDSEDETSEEEDQEEEEEEEEEEVNQKNLDESSKEQSKRKTSTSTQSESDSDKSDVFASSNKKKYQDDDTESKSDEESEDDDDMFKTKKKTTNNLFSDDDENFEEEKKKPKPKSTDNEFSGSEDKDKDEEVEPVKKPKALDFAAELSSKLAASKKKKEETSIDNENEESTQASAKIETKPTELKKTIKTNAISLFDNSSEEEENSMFASKSKTIKETAKIVKKTSLFSESDSDKENETEITKKPTDIPVKLNDATKTTKILSKIDSDSSDDVDFLKKPPQVEPKKPTTPIVKNEKKFSIFDDDDDDEDGDDLIKAKSSTAKMSTIKEKEPEKLETGEKLKPQAQAVLVQKPKSSLFDEDDEDDLFKDTSKNKSEATKIPEIKEETEAKQPSKVQAKNLLFDPLALKSSGLFNKLSENTLKDKSDDETPLPDNLSKESQDNSKKANIDNEIPKKEIIPAKKSTLFDDEEDDLFNAVKNLPKKDIPNPKKENLFDETLDIKDNKPNEKKIDEANSSANIFKEEKETLPISVKTNPAKKSLFDNSSEEEEEDTLFSSKKQVPKVTPQPKNIETKETVSNKAFTDKIVQNTTDAEKIPKLNPAAESSEKKIPNTTEENKNDTKTTSTITSGKNQLFDPLGLKSSGLFKKLAQNISDSDENEVEKQPHDTPKKNEIIQDTKKELDENDDLFGSSSPVINFKRTSTSNNKKQSLFDDFVETKEPNENKNEIKSNQVSSSTLNTQEPELFEGIITDRSFSEQSFKNVQKDRIKVSAKKRAPTQRPKITISDQESDLFDKQSLIEDTPEVTIEKSKPNLDEKIEKVPKTDESKLASETIDEEVTKAPKIGLNKGKNLLFDPLALKSSGLFKKVADKTGHMDEETKNKIEIETETFRNKEEKVEIKSKLNNENDEDSLFSIKKPIVKETAKKDSIFDDEDLFQPKKSTNKDSGLKVESKIETKIEDNSFDDLFKPAAIKKETTTKKKTAIDNIFDDDDIFSNTSFAKTNKTTTANLSVKKPIDDDIFGNMNDDDIFKPTNNKAKKKTNETKSKNEIFDDFEDPLK